MSVPQIMRLRRIAGLGTSLVLLAALLSLLDGLVGGLKGNVLTVETLPGQTSPVTGPLPQGASALEDVRILGEDDGVHFVFEELFTGFWLGGNMWRGTVVVDRDAAAGERLLRLEAPPLVAKPQGAVTIKVVVYPDRKAMSQASPSYITRHFDLEPFWVCAAFFCLALSGAGASFLLAKRLEGVLAGEGKAVIYMIKQTEQGVMLAFSLGSRQGLAPDRRVRVLDRRGEPTGTAVVNACTAGDCTALLDEGSASPGAMAWIDPSLR